MVPSYLLPVDTHVVYPLSFCSYLFGFESVSTRPSVTQCQLPPKRPSVSLSNSKIYFDISTDPSATCELFAVGVIGADGDIWLQSAECSFWLETDAVHTSHSLEFVKFELCVWNRFPCHRRIELNGKLFQHRKDKTIVWKNVSTEQKPRYVAKEIVVSFPSNSDEIKLN